MAENQNGKAHAQQNESTQTHQPVPPTHVVIDPSSATVHIKPEPDDSEKPSPEKPWKQFLRPEWVIVDITAIYVFISALMLIAIKRQADLTEVTAKRQLRAYLCVDEACVKITTIAMVDGPGITILEGQLNIKNGGQTPAYCVKTWVHGSIDVYPNNIPIPPPPESMRRGEGIVPAQGKSIIVTPETRVAPQVMENLRNPLANVAYYVQAEACYRDIFKDWHRLKIRVLCGGPTRVRTTKDSKGVTVGLLVPDSWGNYEEDIQCDPKGNPI